MHACLSTFSPYLAQISHITPNVHECRLIEPLYIIVLSNQTQLVWKYRTAQYAMFVCVQVYGQT